MRLLLTIATVVVALLVPVLLVTTSLRIVANDWIVSFEYDHGGVPEDRYGLTEAQRRRLALLGLDSILPGGRGVALLEEARLPDGRRAFDTRELQHMQDVRDVVGAIFRIQLAALVLLAVLTVALVWRAGPRRAWLRGLRSGAIATLALAVGLGVLMLAAWDRFFVDFHGVFFEGDTWRFARTDTLLRLYPDEFWIGVAAWLTGIALAGALVILVVTTVVLRRSRPRAGR